MKNDLLKYCIWLTCVIVGGCHSSRSSLLFSGTPQNPPPETFSDLSGANLPDSGHPLAGVQHYKTVAQSPEKVLYAANHSQPEPTFLKPQAFPVKNLHPAIAERKKNENAPAVTLKKQEEPDKVKGKRLSGFFVGSGMALLLVALVLLLVGSSAAGLVAIIGGSLFLIGFVCCMVALLGR